MHGLSKDDNSRKLVRGENERHDGAVTCPEVRRVISVLIIGGNLNLRRKSTKISATMDTSRTQVSVGGQVGVGAGAGGGGGGGPPAFVVVVFGGPLGEGELAPCVVVGFGGPLGEAELAGFVVGFAELLEGLELTGFVVDFAELLEELELLGLVAAGFVEALEEDVGLAELVVLVFDVT